MTLYEAITQAKREIPSIQDRVEFLEKCDPKTPAERRVALAMLDEVQADFERMRDALQQAFDLHSN